MAFTRMAVSIGIVCSVWMASPLTANAQSPYEKFVGLSDKGTTKVKRCGDGKGGSESFASGTAFNVQLDIDLGGGDGTRMDGDDAFAGVFSFGTPAKLLFSGNWSKIDDGKETYQLTLSGDLAELSTDPLATDPIRIRELPLDSDVSGWERLLGFINEQAGCACERDEELPEPFLGCTNPEYPVRIYPALSDVAKGTLVVHTGVEVACPAEQGFCTSAEVKLDVKTFMEFADDGWGDAKVDLVQFKYKAKGYVVSPSP